MKPLRDEVVIKQQSKDNKTEAGIILTTDEVIKENVGVVTANKLIQKYTNVPLKDLWKIVKGIYKDKGYTAKEALAQARVARILRHGDYNKKTGKVKLWQIR